MWSLRTGFTVYERVYSEISHFYADFIPYSDPNVNAGLVNLCKNQRRPSPLAQMRLYNNWNPVL